jgi:hypothetical protein
MTTSSSDTFEEDRDDEEPTNQPAASGDLENEDQDSEPTSTAPPERNPTVPDAAQ